MSFEHTLYVNNRIVFDFVLAIKFYQFNVITCNKFNFFLNITNTFLFISTAQKFRIWNVINIYISTKLIYVLLKEILFRYAVKMSNIQRSVNKNNPSMINDQQNKIVQNIQICSNIFIVLLKKNLIVLLYLGIKSEKLQNKKLNGVIHFK